MDRARAIRVLEEIAAWKYCDAESAAAKVAIAALCGRASAGGWQ